MGKSMQEAQVILSVNNISKKFNPDKKRVKEAFWALKNISFTLKQGEILGIIGANGAGKSTLLKILSEILPPTEGHIELNGSLLSILDVGTGFHPDLSGYDNIFFNASLLGMKKKQVQEKINDIINFSGIQNFIHEPVKNYSSGMYLRLAMSVALFTNNDILLLDEVISVGDAEFRHKAIQKIRELVAGGRSCILISHDLGSVISLCDSCIVLEKGEVAFYGKSRKAVENYLEAVNRQIVAAETPVTDHPKCRFIFLSIEREHFTMNEEIEFSIQYEKKVAEDIDIVLEIRNLNSVVMTDCEIYRPHYQTKELKPGIYHTRCIIPANLFNHGTYFIDLIFGDKVSKLLNIRAAGRFLITLPAWEADKKWNEGADNIPFRPVCHWQTLEVNEQL